MFIRNNFGEYIKVSNIVAVEVVENIQGAALNIYTESSKITKVVEYGTTSDTVTALLNHLRIKHDVHIVHIGDYYLVIEAIDSILMDAYGLHVKTHNQDFTIVLSDNDRAIAMTNLERYLPVFDF